jgi:hypothetical protein
MAGTTRLKLYNGALELCGERALSSLTETRKGRRLLDNAWDRDAVRACLEMGHWQFAMRSVQIDDDASIDPQFGYTYAFNKPDDFVQVHAVCSDEFFKSPLTQYTDETDNWFASITPLYVRYVSDGEDYGTNYAEWPQSFCDYVEAYLASKIVWPLTHDKEKTLLICGSPDKMDSGLVGKRLKIAKNRAAWREPSMQPPEGMWIRARRGRFSGNGRPDGGNPGSLIG